MRELTFEQFVEVLTNAKQCFDGDVHYGSILNVMNLCYRLLAEYVYPDNECLRKLYYEQADAIYDELQKLGYYDIYDQK